MTRLPAMNDATIRSTGGTRSGVFKLGVAVALAVFVAGCAETGGRKEVGGLLGAIGGGLLGAQVGSGSGRLIATGAGAVLGGLIGADIGDGVDKAKAAQRTALVNHPQQAPIRQNSIGYRQSPPNYGGAGYNQPNYGEDYGGTAAPAYSTSGCNRLSGGFKPAFACKDNFGRWYVVQ